MRPGQWAFESNSTPLLSKFYFRIVEIGEVLTVSCGIYTVR